MAADIYIHVIPTEPVTAEYAHWTIENHKNNTKPVPTTVTKVVDEGDLAIFFASTMGSKWFSWDTDNVPEEKRSITSRLIVETPNVWVGEVSWLKGALFDNPDKFIPSAVEAVYDVIGEELPVIDDELIAKIHESLNLDNNTSYSVVDGSDVDNPVIKFLKEHKGLRCFTVSW